MQFSPFPWRPQHPVNEKWVLFKGKCRNENQGCFREEWLGCRLWLPGRRQCGARPLNGGCLGPQPIPLGLPEQMSVLELPGLIGNLLLGRAGPSRACQLPSFSLPLSTLAVSEIGRNNHCSSNHFLTLVPIPSGWELPLANSGYHPLRVPE